MTDMAMAGPGKARGLPAGDLALAMAGALFVLLLALAAGLPKLSQPGIDNDSLMRLVTVRDLLAGQSWFDPMQYRMGTEGGFAMHWSRLVDAPVALLAAVMGETAAAFVWPGLLLVAALALVVRCAAVLGGPEARFPALVLAGAAFHFLGIFAPGSFDHHNVQLVLVLAMVAGLLSASLRGGVAAGAAAAVSLAVGMETLPLVAAGGMAVAVAFWLRGMPERDCATGFGLGFAGSAALALIATMPPTAWSRAACDAYSGGHAATAVVAGLGLALAVRTSAHRSAGTRLAALAVTALLAAAVVLVAMPACLGGPYAELDPRLRADWLDWVVEAQPIMTVLFSHPAQAATNHATPLVALVLLATGVIGPGDRRGGAIIGLLLAVAAAVSWWQLRGAVFSLALAVPVLAAWIAALRGNAGGAAGSLRLAAGWLLSFNVAWGLLASSAVALAAGAGSRVAEDQTLSACVAASDYATLAGLPATTVVAVSNHGAPILGFTAHRALAGPYHRNQAGNLAVLDILTGDVAQAEAASRRQGARLVAVCPGNDETQVLAARAPDGLLAGLVAGRVPGWLEPVETGQSLRIYRIRSAIAP